MQSPRREATGVAVLPGGCCNDGQFPVAGSHDAVEAVEQLKADDRSYSTTLRRLRWLCTKWVDASEEVDESERGSVRPGGQAGGGKE